MTGMKRGGNHRLHGFTHAKLAAENAKRYCHASEKELAIIRTHMWPLNLTKLPKSREAWVLTACDKITTIAEVLKINN